jgi:DNA-binding MarR family transcriptional regulator/GNAT superfamily N-acetyltransferase
MVDSLHMPVSAPTPIDAVRSFSRFYTSRIGLLHEGLLGSDLSLAEGRIVYELGHRGSATAGVLAAELGLDPGYLSRLLRGFEERGLIEKTACATDGRQRILSLSASGRALFKAIDARSAEEIAALIGHLTPAEQTRLVAALGTTEALLGGVSEAKAPIVLRPPRPGDIGWVVHRHGALYAAEYGWDESFEALVAEIAANFLRTADPKRERCWLAERGEAILGSVFLVRHTDEVAKLRLLYVEPAARGHGLGRLLVRECLRFAAAVGYRQISLWTNDVLVAARAIYRSEGFRMVASEPHHSFGKDLVSETWERELQRSGHESPSRSRYVADGGGVG